jgi:hypothetical protein
VAGLARRVQDSGTLRESWRKLVVSQFNALPEDRQMLARRVATRWNADYDCLNSHLYFRTVVEAFTAQTDNGCGAYRLNAAQWVMAKQLEDLLYVC